jgi:eukaryotic-like serine/threonine-protein kinase
MDELQARTALALADQYDLEGRVGQGGAAVVFAARDRKHDRRVAIKVLRPEVTAELGAERFLREIRVAARLSHPHIVPLHDSGQREGLLYYVMPFVDGESLGARLARAGALPLERVIAVAEQVASALDYAHQNGVVHRDVKPENILLFRDVAMVADFGVAVAVRSAGRERVTGGGMAIGTPAYMSPEQASGEEVDERSDVYSLGCVVYHMLTGDPPFRGATPQAIMARHALDEVPSPRTVRPALSEELERVVLRALAKIPADRFVTAGEFARALKDPAAVAGGVMVPAGSWSLPGGSIAVLPFANLSADPDNEYFCDGMTEEIINTLSNVPALKVAARTSSFSFKGKSPDIRTVGQALGVRMVLEGSVRRVGDRLRVTAQLANAANGYQLWSERFDRQMVDVFAIQEEIARSIAETLKVRFTTSQQARPLVRPGTDDLDAYDSYLKGRHYWNRRALPKALEYFQLAVERDPNYALGYAGIADGLSFLGYYGFVPPDLVRSKGRAAAEQAVHAGPDLAEAHYSLGLFEFMWGWDMTAAGQALQRAVELRPGLAQAHATLTQWHSAFGREEAAREAGDTAVGLDPLSSLVYATIAFGYSWLGLREEALRLARRAVDVDAGAPHGHWVLGMALVEADRVVEATSCFERAVDLVPDSPYLLALHAGALAQAGREAAARLILERLERPAGGLEIPACLPAWVHARLGDAERALVLLQRAFPGHSTACLLPAIVPSAAAIGADPRYGALLEQAGLAGLRRARDAFRARQA